MTETTVWRWPHNVKLFEPTPARPYYRITYRTRDGQRRQPSGGTDFDTAFAKAKLIEEDLASAVGDGQARTVTQLAAAFMADMAPDWTPRYIQDQQHHLDTWVTPAIGKLAAAELTRDDIKPVLAAPNYPVGVTQLRATVGGMLTWGYDHEWVPVPRAALITAVRKTAKKDAGRKHGESRLFIAPKLRPSAEACGALADAIAIVGGDKMGRQFWLMIAVAASTGVRGGELFALRPADVNLAAGTLAVDRQLIRIKGEKPFETLPKWGRTRVTIVPETTIWGAPLRDPLAEWMAGRDPHGLLFPAQRGTWVTGSNFTSRALTPARKTTTGWAPKWALHSLRHSFCSHLLASWEEERDADGNITRAKKVAVMAADVCVLGGHRDPGVTTGMYVQATTGIADRVNAILA